MWKTRLRCDICNNRFEVTKENIEYKDIAPENYLVSEWSYITYCPECDHMIVMTAMPSDIAIEIQRVSA